MINKHNKGNRTEKIARDIAKQQGYIVEVKNWSRFQPKDFFGIFDMVCLKDREIKWVQVKSNKNDVSKAKKEIKEWISSNGILNPPHSCEVWLWLGKTEFEVSLIN